VEVWAQKAVRGYRNRHPKLHLLAHDIGVHWLARGDYASALQVFRSLRRHFTNPRGKLAVTGNIAYAAGCTGNRDEFEAAVAEGEQILDSVGASESGPGMLLFFGRGALKLGLWDRAEEYARRALRMAEEREENKRVFEAEGLLEEIAASRDRVPLEPPELGDPSAFAEELAERLSAVP
jgi:tetratricopeptide (TPR) repeat protein